MVRRYGVPKEIQDSISRIINGLGYSFTRPRELAKVILETSDYFNQSGAHITPWSRHTTLAAYLAYFLPLGLARVQAVVSEAERLNFFQGLNKYIDWGSGPGTLSLILQNTFKNGQCVELSREAIELHQKLTMERKNIKWTQNITSRDIEENNVNSNLLLALSYSLNELPKIPDWIFSTEALIIIEPSTHQAFNRLSELRNQLLNRGWHLWAPCTHVELCPLKNEKDWCHDRILFDPPFWWSDLEAHLPMKNKSVTFSYLLARKNESLSPQILQQNTHCFFSADESEVAIQGKTARIVGDLKIEKGKTRQMICRSSEREFLAWLHKDSKASDWPRGELVLISNQCEKVANEIRKIKKPRP